MKVLALFALVAAVSADPYYYNAWNSWATPLAYSHAIPAVRPVSYHAAAPGTSLSIVKREAEADAWWPYTTYAGHYAAPLTYTSHVAAPVAYAHPVAAVAGTYGNHAISPFNYAAKGRYVAKSGTTVHVAKREAEAEADAWWPYTTYAGQYAAPLTYTSHVAAPVAYAHPVAAVAGTYGNHAVSPFNYAAKGRYVAKSGTTVHIAKREAEADAWWPYTTAYAAPVAYSSLHRPYTAYSHVSPYLYY